MKMKILTVSMLGALASFGSQADTLLGLYVGAQAWNMETVGGFSDDGTNLDFNFKDKTPANFYAALEHPLPLVPNLKLQRTSLDTSGSVDLTSTFTFGDKLFTADSTALSDINLTSTDAILYYEIFDNDLISFDLGINAKYLDGELIVTDSEDSANTAMKDFSGVLPMIYSRIAVGIPATGLGAYIEGSYLSFDDHTLTDYQAALTYSLMENLALDVTFQLGYRSLELELDDLDGVYSNLQFKGAFAGLEVHF